MANNMVYWREIETNQRYTYIYMHGKLNDTLKVIIWHGPSTVFQEEKEQILKIF